MKHIKFIAALYSLFLFAGCNKDSGNYPGGDISPYISLYDIRALYKNNDVTLSKQNMNGAEAITGVVVSDHSGNNLPEGLLILEDKRRLSSLRGISVDIGQEAANYKPGDSVRISVTGALLTRNKGLLMIKNVSASAVTKLASDRTIPQNIVTAQDLLANPDNYESTLAAIVQGGPDPLPSSPEKFAGQKQINDGFGDLSLITNSSATFADSVVPTLGNFYCIIFDTLNASGKLVPQLRMRTGKDFNVLKTTLSTVSAVIAGFMSDPNGSDANYEYVQFLAVRDIDFSKTPMSIVTTNNAGGSTPTGFPAQGWATGGLRTYKFNLTSGNALKGTFFYVGCSTKLINSKNSTSIADANWIRALDYTKNAGDDFGAVTTNLFANSGNAFGIALFGSTKVTADSIPMDVVFIGTGGSLYTAGPPERGYRITDNDFYDITEPLSLQSQPYYRNGTNTLSFKYNPPDMGYFNMLSGVYKTSLGRWTKARIQNVILLTKTSTLRDIEDSLSTTIEE